MTKRKKINFALQGGGAHGAITWGVLDRLLEDDRIDIDSISGASAGAVNAVALAYGLHLGGAVPARAKLEEVWRTISEVGWIFNPVKRSPLDMILGRFNVENSIGYKIFDAFTRIYSPYQFNPLNFNPLKEVLNRCINFEELRKCDRYKLFLSATNVKTGKVHIFRTSDASVDVVCASTCLPFLYQAVKIDGKYYWDGGYMGNPPLFPFFYESESRDIVIVHVNPLNRSDVPSTAPEIFNRINEISFNSSLLRELRAIAFVHKLLDENWLKDEHRDRLRNIHIHSVRSDEALLDLSIASKFNVEWAFLQELKERGRKIADSWIEKTYKDIGERSSVDLRAMFDSA
ncbi:MAG: patatin-like phospholipase family protein [Alphaproteobacteria bacterium]|nr:patatin-like phospholipase family protein [Alphaproteobacteria bacterium]